MLIFLNETESRNKLLKFTHGGDNFLQENDTFCIMYVKSRCPYCIKALNEMEWPLGELQVIVIDQDQSLLNDSMHIVNSIWIPKIYPTWAIVKGSCIKIIKSSSNSKWLHTY